MKLLPERESSDSDESEIIAQLKEKFESTTKKVPYTTNFAGEKFCQRLVLCIEIKILPNLISPTARALGRT